MTILDPTNAPVPTEETEPMLLLDVTGSMNYPTSSANTTPRRTTIQEAISIVVATLAERDSQAEHEEGGGGLRTVTFADGTAADVGDLNPNNLRTVWGKIHWGGGTYIMPGFKTLQRVYSTEFGSLPVDQRPKLLALIITDGEAEDTSDFAQAMSQVGGGTYIELAIVGYGTEHDRALAAYQRIATQNTHIKVTSLEAETDPQAIAEALLRMIA